MASNWTAPRILKRQPDFHDAEPCVNFLRKLASYLSNRAQFGQQCFPTQMAFPS
jgi:hypothetical protein